MVDNKLEASLPEMADEQAADLRRLTAAAAEPDAEVQRIEGAQADAELAAENDLIAKNAAGLSLVFDLAGPTFAQFGFPSVAAVLTEKNDDTGLTAGQTLSCVWAPVLAKYGIDMSLMSDKYKLEITAVMVTLPIAKALYAAVQHDTVGKRSGQAKAVAAAVVDQPSGESPKAVSLG